MTDIVAVAFGSYVTNNTESIAKAMQGGLKPRLITRMQAECLANIFNLDTWKQLAKAPVLLAAEELTALKSRVAATADSLPTASSETLPRKRKPRSTRAKSPTKAVPRHS